MAYYLKIKTFYFWKEHAGINIKGVLYFFYIILQKTMFLISIVPYFSLFLNSATKNSNK